MSAPASPATSASAPARAPAPAAEAGSRPCQLAIDVHLAVDLIEECDFLLQMEVAELEDQVVSGASLECSPTHHSVSVEAQDAIGQRIWLRGAGRFEARYSAGVRLERPIPVLDGLAQLPPRLLPAATVPYLFASRFCPADRLGGLVEDEFAAFEGGARIAAISEWISQHIAYRAGASTPVTTALDTLGDRAGVCRDFAHVLISLARASAMPARYAAVYAPGVEPQDFHAVAEVFLADPGGESGSWHLVDPTGMALPAQMARIGIGRDAADVSFLTSFGAAEVCDKTVSVAVV